MLAHLTAALDGSAQQILWDLPSQTKTNVDTVIVIQGRFGAKHQGAKYRLELTPHVEEIILGLPWIEEDWILWDASAYEREIIYKNEQYAPISIDAAPMCGKN